MLLVHYGGQRGDNSLELFVFLYELNEVITC